MVVGWKPYIFLERPKWGFSCRHWCYAIMRYCWLRRALTFCKTNLNGLGTLLDPSFTAPSLLSKTAQAVPFWQGKELYLICDASPKEMLKCFTLFLLAVFCRPLASQKNPSIIQLTWSREKKLKDIVAILALTFTSVRWPDLWVVNPELTGCMNFTFFT